MLTCNKVHINALTADLLADSVTTILFFVYRKEVLSSNVQKFKAIDNVLAYKGVALLPVNALTVVQVNSIRSS